ncbi:hypothetical protein ACFO3J_15750 [Streptomyces polygonati]|uniref:L,D-transpeptidase n=1 Tax=Streptomyces polygonati TaxID=1617087 RepID=A0ABV8HLP2_9ACTN
MVRIKAGALVTGLVGTALLAVGTLALVAASSAPDAAALAAARTAGKARASGAAPLLAVPADSGSGKRVVYSVARDRVWLIDDHERLLRTFPVHSGAVHPAPGPHRVFARRALGVGGDGRKVQHIVLFARTPTANIGFSETLDGSFQPPAPAKRTGAIRETRSDGTELWQRATIGSRVEVVG